MITSSRPLDLSLSLFASVVVAAAMLAGCGGGQIVCTGGGRLVGTGCFCARGQTWDGAQCVGTPETGNCTQKGAMEVVGTAGSVCFCPDGWIWTDANRTECVACTGGAQANGDTECVCPGGTAWVDNACQQVAAPQPVAEQMTCTGGAIATDQGCQCQQGTVWDGNNCVVAEATPPQQIQIQQHTVHSTQSFTCCINHAQYTCPNQAAFQACATLSPNHGCTPAGGC
jgi:hypothetical protein